MVNYNQFPGQPQSTMPDSSTCCKRTPSCCCVFTTLVILATMAIGIPLATQMMTWANTDSRMAAIKNLAMLQRTTMLF